MNTVYWLTRSEADRPGTDDWLAPGEAAVVAKLTVPKRRRDWLLGRWTAKQALAAWPGLSLPSPDLPRLEIRAAADGAPEPFFAGEPLPVSLSLSHRGGRSLCALLAGAAVGCDLERIEPRSERFVKDYFTRREQALVAAAPEPDRPLYENLIWSAKESALKALRLGLSVDTRTVEVNIPASSTEAGWKPLEVRRVEDGKRFAGWWRRDAEYIITLAATRPLEVPERLALRNLSSGDRPPAPSPSL